MSEILKSLIRNQKKTQEPLLMFSDIILHLEILPTYLGMHCQKCPFHMDNHINKILRKEFQDEVVYQKSLTEKPLDFLVPSQRFSYFQNILQSKKLFKKYQFSHYCNSSMESLRLSALLQIISLDFKIPIGFFCIIFQKILFKRGFKKL